MHVFRLETPSRSLGDSNSVGVFALGRAPSVNMTGAKKSAYQQKGRAAKEGGHPTGEGAGAHERFYFTSTLRLITALGRLSKELKVLVSLLWL